MSCFIIQIFVKTEIFKNCFSWSLLLLVFEVYDKSIIKTAPRPEVFKTQQNHIKRVLFKTLECFPSTLFPKLWNSIELELKETKSSKSFKRKVAENYLDSYASYICKKNCVSCG